MRGTLIALIAGAVLIAGCGGGDDNDESAAKPAATATATQAPADDSGGGGGAETLKFSAPSDGSLKFEQGHVTAKAGKVTVDFANPSSTPHAVEIEGNGVEEKTETVTGGDAPPVTVDLKPGTYEYYCPVPGHKEAGMKGTLTVQ
jgi:plastocyanin